MADESTYGAAPPRQLSAKDRKRSLIAMLIGLGVAVIVFGFILPQVIDYQQVWETITSLSATDLLILLAAGLIYYIPEGWLYAVVMPGMSLWRGIKAWVASTGVGSTVPAADLVIRFGMYRSWGFSIDHSMRGIVLSGAFDWVVKFSIPVIAIILLGLFGVGDFDGLEIIALIAGALLIVTIVVLVGLVRSHAFTERVAGIVERAANWGLRRFNQPERTDIAPRVIGFRDDGVEIARTRGVWAFLASALGKLWQYVMLVLALRMVGIEDSVLSLSDIFIVWAIVLLITMIPITPGGIGIAEFFYIWLFTQIAGQEWANTIAAGVMLYLVIQWALPIPIGWGTVWWWRRRVRRGDLPDPFTMSDQEGTA